ncbi:MAG: hypothetical protein K2X99_05160 [Gemmatimonadaceae bacterium]|nr:hypothetical protein [Gemmatimonadaceae bacterium]
MDSNAWFVTAAYALTWVVVIGYAVHVHRTVRAARAELAAAERESR